MGWASGDQVFDPVARELIAAGAEADMKRRVLSVLIRQLRERGWDTEGESLGLFADDPAIVEAFRENGIVQNCGDEDGPDDSDWCSQELGHDGNHRDDLGHSWPQTAEGAS
jgi:hypothetical protein